MSEQSIFAIIDGDLKKKAQKQAIDLDIDLKDYVSLALTHFSEHIENGELAFTDERFSE